MGLRFPRVHPRDSAQDETVEALGAIILKSDLDKLVAGLPLILKELAKADKEDWSATSVKISTELDVLDEAGDEFDEMIDALIDAEGIIKVADRKKKGAEQYRVKKWTAGLIKAR